MALSLAGKQRTWLIAVLVIPAAIYLFYFYTGAREGREAGRAEQIPETYLMAGAPARLDGGTYRAGTDGWGLAYYNTLKAGGNKIMPEPGLVFAVVPVLVPAAGEDGQGSRTWSLIDDSGRGYRPISTDTGRLSNIKRLEERDMLPDTAPEYLLFKVKEGTPAFYLKLSTDRQSLYWRLVPD